MMMTNETVTAREVLARIEKRYFRGARLREACLKEGAERREYVLAQVERLLNAKQGDELMAVHLSDEFWTADEGRHPMHSDMPLLTEVGLRSLTKEERLRASLIKDVAGLCHDLALHFEFDLRGYLGVRNDWRIRNKRLVEWLTDTEHGQIAVHTSYVMKKHAIDMYEDMHYLPAQDALAMLFSKELRQRLGRPTGVQRQPKVYVEAITSELLRIERHWQRGKRLGLEPEVVILHDEIWGVVPRQFSSGVLRAAQELFDWMDAELKGKGATDENMERFTDKVREIRIEHLGEGWIKDYSLEFNYLLSHAELCASGYWQGEGKAI